MTAHSWILYIGALALFVQSANHATDAFMRAVEGRPWRAFGNVWASLGAIVIGCHVWIAA